MSLVANYTDSEEEDQDQDQSQGEDNTQINSATTVQQNIEVTDSVQSPKTLRNPFGVNDVEYSSDSSSEDEDKDKTNIKKVKDGSGTLLDNPFRYFGSASVASEDSVFRVEFREQDAKKTAVLEKHVKMSQVTPAATMINGKKICFNNRKGRCRFGHNCKFAHDTDTAVIDPDSVVIKLPDKNFLPVQAQTTEQVPAHAQKRNPFCMDKIDWDSETPVALSSLAQLSGSDGGLKKGRLKDDDNESEESYSKPKKKRPGLVMGLSPGVKVMKMYYNNKEKDKS